VVHVKVCGVTRLEDAVLAAELGAAAVGFVFWPGSPRYVDPARAARIVRAMPPMTTAVGVFVDQPLDEVRRMAEEGGLGAVQLHGSESPDYCRQVGRRVIKSLAVAGGERPVEIDLFPEGMTLLLDARDPVRRGGTGQTIDWNVAALVAAERRVILSGGLDPGNVAAAIEKVRPYAVDVASGVEERPGMKEASKLRAFFEAVRRTAASDALEHRECR